jgi:quinol monooxygenase YgiN
MSKDKNQDKVALLVRIEAKPGKENEVSNFLRNGLPIVQAEQGTTNWFAMRMGPTSFGIFDTFHDDQSRQEHLAGKIAAMLMAKSPDLFAKPPTIERVDILAEKVSHAQQQ